MFMVVFPDIDPVLLPADGRFGCGPSKVRPDQLQALFTPLLMGTSHRAAPVRGVVASLKEGLRTLLSVPDDYEIILGNGGASAFWDMACACLISSRAAFGSWGAFGAKFASEAAHAPHLATPLIDEAAHGSLVTVSPREKSEGVDVYAYPHNETSTGVTSPVYRVEAPDALTLVDGTSIAGAAPVDRPRVGPYFSPLQLPLGPAGALWSAAPPPAPVEAATHLAPRPRQPQIHPTPPTTPPHRNTPPTHQNTKPHPHTTTPQPPQPQKTNHPNNLKTNKKSNQYSAYQNPFQRSL